jgi:hypothetical protein
MSMAVLHDVAPDTSARARVRRWLPTSSAIAWISMAALAAVRAGKPEERDPYWEARAGLENLSGIPLARPDTWSWAPLNHDFFPNSPAWNYLLGISWWTAGFWGLFVFAFLVIFGYLALAYLMARKLGAHPLGALAGVVGGFAWAMPMLSSRGTIGVQILLLLGMFIPTWWRPRLERRSAWASAGTFLVIGACLSTLGNWIHLSFFFLGPALAACWGVYWLTSDWPGSWRLRLADRRRWAVTLGGTIGLVLGSLTTPYGVAGTMERSRETAEACSKYILEWVSPFNPGFLRAWQLAIQWPVSGLVGAASIVLLVRWWIGRVRTGSVNNRFALISSISILALPLAIAGMFALRFLGAAVLLFIPIWGTAITWAAHRVKQRAEALGAHHRFKETANRWTQTASWRNVLTIVLALLLPFAIWLSLGLHARPAEMDAIESLPSGCRLFTTAWIAGPTILTRHDVPVWIDGRADYYGPQRLADLNAYLSGTGDTAAPPGATCAIFPALTKADKLPGVTARLNADPQWRFVATINSFDVWLRTV